MLSLVDLTDKKCHMKWIKFDVNYDSKVTGVKNADCAVWQTKKSFL